MEYGRARVISYADGSRQIDVMQRVCVLADLCLGRWKFLSPSPFGPNQIAVDNHFEVTFHGWVCRSSQEQAHVHLRFCVSACKRWRMYITRCTAELAGTLFRTLSPIHTYTHNAQSRAPYQ